MSIYTISDLHLSLSIDKPMDIFGYNWQNYMERLKENWQNTVDKNDTVVIGGDISWATYINDCFKDFSYLNSLNGNKIILKGNHDYWWESLTKLKNYVKENEFSTISFLHNTSFLVEETAICGARGWIDPSFQNFSKDDEKIYLRELERLKLSLESSKSLDAKNVIVFLHYPPITKDLKVNSDYANILKNYGVKKCFYGHLHSKASKNAFEGIHEEIEYKLVSSDYMEFMPYKIT